MTASKWKSKWFTLILYVTQLDLINIKCRAMTLIETMYKVYNNWH